MKNYTIDWKFLGYIAWVLLCSVTGSYLLLIPASFVLYLKLMVVFMMIFLPIIVGTAVKRNKE